MLKNLLNPILTWYLEKLDTGGYGLIALLMAMESSVIPLPSEAIIPVAVWRSEGRLSIFGIIIAGTIGSWVGASIMYWASRWAGRPLILSYGKYFLVSEDKVHGAERWAQRFGSFGVFVARLLPVVRHLIGIPMGIVKMDFRVYSLYTIIGSGIWCTVLALIGQKAKDNEVALKHNLTLVTIGVVAAVAVMGAIYYFFVHRHMKADQKTGN